MTKSPTNDGAEKPDLKPLHDAIVRDLWGVWSEWQNAHTDDHWQHLDLNPVKFSKLSVVSLTWVAAVVGVDAMMTEEQFVDVCRANFVEAYAAAPKFG